MDDKEKKKRGNYRDPIQGFFNFIDMDTGDCWEWSGRKDKDGYGIYTLYRKPTRAHRFSYELFIGDIPKKLVIDHLCRNRSCVNPKHLEVVSNHTNLMRGYSPSALNARRSHCVHGHQLEGENLYIQKKTGKRFCRECDRRRSVIYERKKREAKNARSESSIA